MYFIYDGKKQKLALWIPKAILKMYLTSMIFVGKVA